MYKLAQYDEVLLDIRTRDRTFIGWFTRIYTHYLYNTIQSVVWLVFYCNKLPVYHCFMFKYAQSSKLRLIKCV